MHVVDNWDSHPDKQYIDKLAKHKDGGASAYGTPYVVGWTYKNNDGTFTEYLDQICCQKMPVQDRTKVVGLYFSLRRPDPTHIWWWKNLFDPKGSPWSRLLVEGTTLFSHSNAWVAYLPISKATLFKDIVNFNIATRQPREYPDHVKNFKKFADERPSYTFAEALALFTLKRDDRYHCKPVVFCTGHGMFNQSSAMHLVGQRRPLSIGSSFNDGKDYYSSDQIWVGGGQTYCYSTSKVIKFEDTGWDKAFKDVASVGKPKPLESIFARRVEEYNLVLGTPTLTEEQAINLIRTHGR